MGDLRLEIILMQYFCLLFSLCFHEMAHAAMANYCGDPTARLLGRVTMDPRKHVDPIGTVVMPLFMMITGIPYLFGWAKPVPFNARNLGNMRRDPVLIALAGPASNVIIAVIATLLLRILTILEVEGGLQSPLIGVLATFALYMVLINIALALFNCIPVPPLDGHYVLHFFLPRSGQEALERIGPFGILIAIFIARPLLRPPMDFLLNVVLTYATEGFSGFF